MLVLTVFVVFSKKVNKLPPQGSPILDASNAIKIALVPVVFPVVFIFLEVLFGTIQTLVFALLTLIYITLAAAGHDDHETDEAHAHGPAGATTAGAASAGSGKGETVV